MSNNTTDEVVPNNGSESVYPLPHGTMQVKRWQAGYGEYRTTEAVSTEGLTKRELFAAMAMQALAPQFVTGGDFMEKHVAVGAVTLADALLKELAK